MSTADNSLAQRIRLFYWILPLILVALAVIYQIVAWLWKNSGDNFFISLAIAALVQIAPGSLAAFGVLRLIGDQLSQQEQDRKRSSAAESLLASIVTAARDAIFSVDAHGRIQSWNLGAELLFGYEAMQVMNQPFCLLFGSGRAAQLEAQWLTETVQGEGFVRRHETTCRDVHGQTVNIELTATLLQGNRDQSASISFILRDITGRTRRQEETHRLNVRLKQQAIERAEELTEKVAQLAQANDELKLLNETRSEFISLVSHQIRAPLTNMVGAVHRMQDDCLMPNTTCTHMFTIFEQQVARLNRLVEDVLNANRIEAGDMFLQLEPVSVLPVVRQLAEQFSTRTSSRTIHIAEKPGLPLVYADRDRVAEVLTNLLDNADKYSPPGSDVFIELRADQSEVTIAVRDKGKGLPQQDIERVFDKFYRTDSSDSQQAYGYGLGLYVCRQLIEAQNGRIWAENYSGGGAVFNVALPVWEV